MRRRDPAPALVGRALMMVDREQALEKEIRRLIQGLMTQSDRIVLPAYKQLYEAGNLAIPLLQRELDRADLSKTMRREAMSSVVGLTALLHDIDELASNVFIEKALRFKQNPVLASALRAIQRYSNSKFRISAFNNVRIFEEAALDANYDATSHIKEWLLGIPPEELKGISRVYIVRTKPEFDYLGTYLPMLNVVTVVWQTFFTPGNVMNWLMHRVHKHTLYHEIGHHAHRHKEFGQDPEQEAEAESYAKRLLARTSPISPMFGRLLGRIRK